MTASSLSMDNQTCFQFKASFAPCAILQLTRYDLESLDKQLGEAIAKAPNFFIGSPVLIDLEKVKSFGSLDFIKIKKILHAHALAPMGVRGGSPEQLEAAASQGLPLVNIGNIKKKIEEPKTEEPKAEENKLCTKLITHPIRSGMQVYAKNGDLIVVAQVSSGAELLADGNIHVYGALRGRALAGVQGNTQVRIFCKTLEAELISIAGFYLTKEDIQQLLPEQRGTIEIYLEDEKVRIRVI